MKRAGLPKLSSDELVRRFAEFARRQAYELDANDIGAANKLYDILKAIELELKARGGDQRRALLALYSHPSAQVRVKAALATLALEPELARQKLDEVRNSKEQPQALEAGMALWALDRGIFKPS